MATGRPYTENEITRAIALRAQGISWPAIAARLDRPASALHLTVSNYRKGLWAPAKARARSASVDRKIEALVASGMTSIRQIAKQIGISPAATSQRLGRLGLDYEMRLELAASSNQRAAA